MKVDLHCHSNVSDGLLPPAEVSRRAADNGVELLALTDHDDVAGLVEARAVAEARGLRFLDGSEISVSWRDDASFHVVGLGIDPANGALLAGLKSIRDGRDGRAHRIAEELDKIGIHGAYEGAARYAEKASIISRAHFARFLVEGKMSPDVKSVFDHYLAKGKPGYVPHEWASLEEALRWIGNASGVAVLAHPLRYRVSRDELRAFLGEFKDRGGQGIEVACGAHSAEEVKECARLARHFGLKGSVASDFHGPGESYAELGKAPPLPDDLVPIWHGLI
ncbi:MAG: PHP domain-containing protein [Betaproteobacteria bacterium]|jgi:predicted metal-dependent phosphoesterase TrpH|nr:PHP domain-containing protein [Betaproteobacteria bacterium]